MKIIVNNTSSPGASFTDNTNNVLLKTYHWIKKHPNENISFKDFRMRLQSDEGINDNNNRNIYPLLKNGGLVEYEANAAINTSSFFTETGLAYVKILESLNMLDSAIYTEEQISGSQKRFEEIKQEIIYGVLVKLVEDNETNYVEPLINLCKFLLEFDKISKVEYAYMLYETNDKSFEEALPSLKNNIHLYREGTIDFEIDVNVRNDIEIRNATKSNTRNEGLSYLTSYTYFVALLQQAGLIYKDGKYYFTDQNKKAMLDKLGGVVWVTKQKWETN